MSKYSLINSQFLKHHKTDLYLTFLCFRFISYLWFSGFPFLFFSCTCTYTCVCGGVSTKQKLLNKVLHNMLRQSLWNKPKFSQHLQSYPTTKVYLFNNRNFLPLTLELGLSINSNEALLIYNLKTRRGVVSYGHKNDFI